jgi:3-oxoacyl-[acyl-carrier protein] reductase
MVTGETRGIGRAIAETLVSEGCHVGICARAELSVWNTMAALAAQRVTVTGRADAVVEQT